MRQRSPGGARTSGSGPTSLALSSDDAGRGRTTPDTLCRDAARGRATREQVPRRGSEPSVDAGRLPRRCAGSDDEGGESVRRGRQVPDDGGECASLHRRRATTGEQGRDEGGGVTRQRTPSPATRETCASAVVAAEDRTTRERSDDEGRAASTRSVSIVAGRVCTVSAVVSSTREAIRTTREAPSRWARRTTRATPSTLGAIGRRREAAPSTRGQVHRHGGACRTLRNRTTTERRFPRRCANRTTTETIPATRPKGTRAGSGGSPRRQSRPSTGVRRRRGTRRSSSQADRLSVVAHPLEVHGNRIGDALPCLLDRAAGRHAAWQVGYVGRVVGFRRAR